MENYRRCRERRDCGNCHWYDPLGDGCRCPEGRCKKSERERWKTEGNDEHYHRPSN